jgi:NAD-reducing hydrogenase large subunit
MARLNLCDFAGTPRADRELRRFRRLGDGDKPVWGSFHAHYARLIEILFSLERIAGIIEDPLVHDAQLRSRAGVNQLTGIGVMEAPRGTLFHQYRVNEDGILQAVRLLVATGNNNLAMNRTIAQIARAYIRGSTVTEGVLNRIEHGIRLYDPCLSCSTHAVGQMPMQVQILDARGCLVDEKIRG